MFQMVNNLQCRRPRFDPWVGMIPWRRKWQPTPVLLPGEFTDSGAWRVTVLGSQGVEHDWETNTLTFTLMPRLDCSLVCLEWSHLFCLQSGSLLLRSYSSQRLSAGMSGRIESVLVKMRVRCLLSSYNTCTSPQRTYNSEAQYLSTSLVAQTVKHLPTMRETQAQSLGWEDLLEKEMATHSSILAWKIT